MWNGEVVGDSVRIASRSSEKGFVHHRGVRPPSSREGDGGGEVGEPVVGDSESSCSSEDGEPIEGWETVVKVPKKKKSVKKISWEIVWKDTEKDIECRKVYKTLKDVNKDHPHLTRSRCHYMVSKSKSHKPNRKELKYIMSIKKVDV